MSKMSTTEFEAESLLDCLEQAKESLESGKGKGRGRGRGIIVMMMKDEGDEGDVTRTEIWCAGGIRDLATLLNDGTQEIALKLVNRATK